MLKSKIWDTAPACLCIYSKLLKWIFCKHDHFGKLFCNLINLITKIFPLTL